MRKILAVLFSALLLCACGAILSACGEDPHEHSYTNYVYNNDAKCEADGTETAYCDYDCGESHTRTKVGSALEHIYTNYVYNNDAKCEIDGTETAYCDFNCGESHTRTKVGSALTHNYGDWISNGDNTHTKTCSHDNTHKITENCSGGTATCSQKAVCLTCNREYGNLKDHPYSKEWTITETHHYRKLTCGCGGKKDYGKHTPDDSGFCTACDKAINYTKGIIYDTSSDGTYIEVIGYEGSSTKINIAPTYNNLPVKSIYDGAFRYTNITKVIIPDSVTSIGSSAFSGCSSLTSVTIGDSVTSIGEYAFSSCSSLTNIEIPDSIVSIGNDSFLFCSETVFNIEGNVKYLASKNNKYFIVYDVVNDKLSSYTIKDGAKIIASNAFFGCSRLSSIVIPNSVAAIGSFAFYGCNSLESVTFKDASTWYVAINYDNWANKTGGTRIDVNDPAQNVYYLECYQVSYYWYKK